MRAFPEKIDLFLNCIIAIKNLKSDACHFIVAFGKTQSALKVEVISRIKCYNEPCSPLITLNYNTWNRS